MFFKSLKKNAILFNSQRHSYSGYQLCASYNRVELRNNIGDRIDQQKENMKKMHKSMDMVTRLIGLINC